MSNKARADAPPLTGQGQELGVGSGRGCSWANAKALETSRSFSKEKGGIQIARNHTFPFISSFLSFIFFLISIFLTFDRFFFLLVLKKSFPEPVPGAERHLPAMGPEEEETSHPQPPIDCLQVPAA